MNNRIPVHQPTTAFVGASWLALLLGAAVYLLGLWNAGMPLNEKGYYFTILMYGLFSAVSLQKSVRDRLEGVAVTGLYYGLCWVSLVIAVLLLSVGLWNATLASSEKGFYAMAFLLSLFGGVAVQKNVRDLAQFKDEPLAEPDPRTEACSRQARPSRSSRPCGCWASSYPGCRQSDDRSAGATCLPCRCGPPGPRHQETSMTQTNQGPNLQGQPGQPQPGAINPSSAQGGQGESQPSMTQVDPTKTAGSTGTQMDRQGRALGVDGRQDVPDGQGAGKPIEERRQGTDRRQAV